MSRILLLTVHSIAEHDDLRMLHELGHEVFSIGAYTNPGQPSDDKRPPLPQVPYHADLAALVEGDQMAHKAHLPGALIDWADIIIAHHFVHQWIGQQWPRIRNKRVIWRTCGQSNHELEHYMAQFREDGLEIVRYSPKERNLPYFAGEDALIRFGKEPSEWYGWNGDLDVVGNITQHMKQRGDACGYSFWEAATMGLQSLPAGPGSKEIGGVGELTYDAMRDYLRHVRVYLYTGTQPASYTLGLIEAMMTGVPIVSIGARAFGGPSYVAQLFEGDELNPNGGTDDPNLARTALEWFLGQPREENAARTRQRAIELFGMDTVKPQWAALL